MSFLINHKFKWSFVHIPKTGGTSITNVLRQIDGTEVLAGHDSVRLIKDYKDYFIFTFVRNPFTRLTSAFEHERRKGNHDISFDVFLKTVNKKELWMLPQTYFIGDGSIINYIGKYENFENDLNFILKKLDCNLKIPHVNRNPIYNRHPNLNQEKYYKFFYDISWMKDWVRETYKDDFKIFNYALELPR